MLNNLTNIEFENEKVERKVVDKIRETGEFHFFTYLNGELSYIWIFEENGEYYFRIEDEHENLIFYPHQILIKESHLRQY